MTDNPLKQYFRQPNTYVRLPTQGRWYTPDDLTMAADGELAVYPMGAIDDILLNTPDAMLNGQALEKVVKNCVPDIKNVKRIMIPDLDAIFVAMKAASNNGKADYERKCPNCEHENTFELNCSSLLDTMTTVDVNDTFIKFGNDLTIYVKPYDVEMRQLFIKKEFEEEKAIRALDLNKEMDEIEKASKLSESVDRIAQLTFNLVARSIEKIVIHAGDITVTDPTHIREWLLGITKEQSDIVIETVNNLNKVGIMKELTVTCTSCSHQWQDQLSFDPTSFFGKR